MAGPLEETVAVAVTQLEPQYVGPATVAADQTVRSNEPAPVARTTGDGDLGSRRVWSDDAVPSPSPSRRRLVLAVALVAGIAVVAVTSLFFLPGRTAPVAQSGRDPIERPAPRPEPAPVAGVTERTEPRAERPAPVAPTTLQRAGVGRSASDESSRAPTRHESPRPRASRPRWNRPRRGLIKVRRAAEQAGANFYAHKLFVSAQAREREGIAALGRSDQASALQMLIEAEAAYAAAAEAARREAETERQLAPVKAALEEAQAKASTSRKQALTAEADRVVKDLFHAAQARHVQADDLLARQNLPGATQAYLDAADRYGAATRQAEGKPETK